MTFQGAVVMCTADGMVQLMTKCCIAIKWPFRLECCSSPAQSQREEMMWLTAAAGSGHVIGGECIRVVGNCVTRLNSALALFPSPRPAANLSTWRRVTTTHRDAPPYHRTPVPNSALADASPPFALADRGIRWRVNVKPAQMPSNL